MKNLDGDYGDKSCEAAFLILNEYPNFGSVGLFPKPCRRHCTMLPFVFGDKSSLPELFWPYWDLIEACVGRHLTFEGCNSERGRVGYLTVEERNQEEFIRLNLFLSVCGNAEVVNSGILGKGGWVMGVSEMECQTGVQG